MKFEKRETYLDDRWMEKYKENTKNQKTLKQEKMESNDDVNTAEKKGGKPGNRKS